MVIVKRRPRVSRLDGVLSPGSRASISDDGSELRTESSAHSEVDSGMGSDEGYDSSEELGTELCQLGDQSCRVPIELYDLPDLGSILSVDTWNDYLSEEERFALAAYLPDMDQETFAWTLTELLSGSNFHFGSPLAELFKQLTGARLEQSITLYRQSLNFFKRRQHYHFLRQYQDSMISLLIRMRDAWESCAGYGDEEKLRVLHNVRCRGPQQHERDWFAGSETDSEDKGSSDNFWNKRRKLSNQALHATKPDLNVLPRSSDIGLEAVKFGRENPKGILKVAALQGSGKAKPPMSSMVVPWLDGADRMELGTGQMSRNQMKGDGDDNHDELEEQGDEMGVHGDCNATHRNAVSRTSLMKPRRNQELLIRYDRGNQFEFGSEDYSGLPHSHRSRGSYQDVTVASFGHHLHDTIKNARYLEKEWMHPVKGQAQHQVEYDELHIRSKQMKAEEVLKTRKSKSASYLKVRYNKSFLEQIGDSHFRYDPRAKASEEKIRSRSVHKAGRSMEHSRSSIMFDRSEETESDSSDQIDPDRSLLKSDYMHDHYSFHMEASKNGLDRAFRLPHVPVPANGSGNRGQLAGAHTVEDDLLDGSNMPISVCATVTRKRKGKVDLMNLAEMDESPYCQSSPNKQMDDSGLMRKKGKCNTDTGIGSLVVVSPDPIISEKGTTDIEPEEALPKKPFSLITPTIHTGFSFSIIHLLSAVRKAMVTAQMEDAVELHDHLKEEDGIHEFKRTAQNKTFQTVDGTHHSRSFENMDVSLDHARQKNLLSLTVHEIVNRVRSNPGDPCILETQEPLQDLVRGVLKILSAKTAPLGAKGWKALVLYEKSNKSWSWVGPISSNLSDNDTIEEETSSEAWGIPHKMLVKLVDAFANWLKNGQEILQQIGSLPEPPITMLQNLDDKERFKELKTQKCPTTISPSSDEARSYFRREEVLRYSIPDRAFSYTAADRKKSIVAPLRRGGGKPSSKARDHFMLKPDRPPHVTILCLVRDAAARLPGSIGTRADVCTLIRDSQYIAEDVSDAQVNQVVSGALDRLHYERDPCVQFDGERKLWVYRHSDREEEDFEDDGTSSTKKWKRPRKDNMEHSDIGVMNDNGVGDTALAGYSSGYDFNPHFNVDSTSICVGGKSESVYNDLEPDIKKTGSSNASKTGHNNMRKLVMRQVPTSNPFRESKLLCQENSTTEDFEDETFGREKPV